MHISYFMKVLRENNATVLLICTNNTWVGQHINSMSRFCVVIFT